MTHVEKTIRDAAEKGWIDTHVALRSNTEANALAFLDPAFWQALGKARGWVDEMYYGESLIFPQWKHHWHWFIDHLAEGKDAESFFATL